MNSDFAILANRAFSSFHIRSPLARMVSNDSVRLQKRFQDLEEDLFTSIEFFSRFSRQQGDAAYGRKGRRGPSPSIQNICRSCALQTSMYCVFLDYLRGRYVVDSVLKPMYNFIHCYEDLLDECHRLIHLLRSQKTRSFLEAAGQTPSKSKHPQQIATMVASIQEIGREATRQYDVFKERKHRADVLNARTQNVPGKSPSARQPLRISE